jgi:hypothetical protein
MIDIDPRGAFVGTQAGFEHMNEGGRIVGGCCVGERAMAPNLESYGHQKARSKCSDGCCREMWSVDALGCRASSPARSVWISIRPPRWASGRRPTLNHSAEPLCRRDRVAALVAFVASPQASSYPNHP